MPKEQPVPGYNVVHIIGQGGQAQVYLAERDHDLLRVALKVLNRALRNDPVFLERFVREYKLVASLDSAYVARIYDQGFSGDYPYIAMEFLPSGTLAARIREGLTTRAALRVASQIAQIAVAEKNLSLGEEELRLARVRYEQGVADNRELIDAENRYTNTSFNLVQAVYNYHAARVDLARIRGDVRLILAERVP